MNITVNSGSATPPYEQVREQILNMAASGVLPTGTRLPTIRQLASDLDLAPGTITRAYRELETAGVVVARGRHGTFIAAAPSLSRREKDRRLLDEAQRLVRMARQLGAAPHETLNAVRQALET